MKTLLMLVCGVGLATSLLTAPALAESLNCIRQDTGRIICYPHHRHIDIPWATDNPAARAQADRAQRQMQATNDLAFTAGRTLRNLLRCGWKGFLGCP
jgi:hypothetical protein